MQSADPATLFQSNASLQIGVERAAKAARTAKGAEYGSPVWLGRRQEDTARLAEGGAGADGGADKVLSMLVRHGEAWAATSGGAVRRINLETGETIELLRGHTAPISSLCLYEVSPSRLLVVTGSWDKSICFWAVRDGRSPAAARPRPVMVLRDAAGDFIKAVHGVPSSNVLLSGGSDRIVRAWDMLALAQWASAMSDDEWNGNALDTPRADVPKPQLLAVLREHTRPITCLATLPGEPGQAEAVRTLFSSDSMGRTLELSLEVSRPSEGKATAAFRVERELRGSETGVYDVRPGWRAEEQQDGSTRWAAEVWTASHDKTARLYVLNEKARSGAPSTSRSSAAGPALGTAAPLAPSRTITHEGYVKSVLALSHLAAAAGPTQAVPEAFFSLLLTGVTEGDVRVWDLAADAETVSSTRRTITGEAVVEGGGAGARRTLEGHWHEVTALQPWWRPLPGPLPDSESEAATDAPPRQQSVAGGEWWVVSGGLDGSIRRWRLADATRPAAPKPAEPAAKPKPRAKNGMTEEEERELAELMSDDE